MTVLVIPIVDTRPACKGYLDNLIDSIELGGYFEYGYQVVLCFDNVSDSFYNYFTAKCGEGLGGKRKGYHENRIRGGNAGFAANSNFGLRYAHKKLQDDAFCVNMDTILPNVKYLNKVRSEGLSTPAQIHIEGSTLDEKIENLNKAQSSFDEICSIKLVGFCPYLSIELMDKVGYFDESFISAFEDDDLSVRSVLAGFNVYETNILVHHEIKDRKEVSNTGAYNEHTLGKNLLKFRAKWGIPANIPHIECNKWILDHHKWSSNMKEE